MIRLRPSRQPTADASPPAPPEAVIRRFFRLIRRFERRRGIEVKAAPEIKARITRLDA